MSKISLIGKVKNRLNLVYKRIAKKPDYFISVGKDEKGEYEIPEGYKRIEEVGEVRSVSHLSLHDVMPHTINWEMNYLKYLEDRNANAFYVDQEKFEQVSHYFGKSHFQPLKLSK